MVHRHILLFVHLAALVAISFLCPLASADASRSSLLVSTTSGLVQGFLDTTTTSVALNKWLGVYFAEDTSGANRWTLPKKTFRPGIQNATAFGPACMQGRCVVSHAQRTLQAH